MRTAIVVNRSPIKRTLSISKDEVIDKVRRAPEAIKRLIEPEEIAEFALYLAPDKASFITGAVHMLDLRRTAR